MVKDKKITKKTTKKKPVLTRTKKGRGKGGGRPKANIEQYFNLMLPYLQRGLSVAKACEHAEVPHTTISDYMAKHPKFSSKIAVAKRTLEIAARQNIANSIKSGSVESAKWYLERICKDEFSLRLENVNENHESDVVVVKLPENGREVKSS